MAIDSTLPGYLAQRAHWTDPTVARDIQLGANLYQESQQEKRMQRAQAMQEELRRITLEEKERIAEGTVEVAKIFSEMGQSGGYTDPGLQGKFWDAIKRHPKFANSPAFKDMMDTFQNAEQAKARSALETLRQEAISDRNFNNVQSRFDLLNERISGMMQLEGEKAGNRERLAEIQSELNILRDSFRADSAVDLETVKQQGRLDLQGARDTATLDRLDQTFQNALKMQDIKAEDAAELRKLQHELNVKRDSLKPSAQRPAWKDLDESDTIGMRTEMSNLTAWRRTHRSGQYDAEYKNRFDAIEKKYEARRKNPSAPATAPAAAPAAAPADDFKARYNALPSGAEYIDPNGVKRIKR
jgi:hypothetical protein